MITDEHIPGLSERHESIQRHVRYFRFGHLDEDLGEVSALCADLVIGILNKLPDGPELINGLHALLEAKDCFVRHALDVRESRESREGVSDD